jgi:hypothetical protein
MKLTVLLLIGALVTPAAALADVVSLAPSKDTTLYSEDGALSNGAGEFVFSGRTGLSFSRRALLAFDVARHVPPGAKITQVTLTLHVSQSPSAAQPESFALHRVRTAWGEGTSNAGQPGGFGTATTPNDATWTHRVWDTAVWAAPGGDFVTAASAVAVVPVTDDGVVTWGSSAALVADVQEWLDRPATDFGWILIGNETANRTARRFDSRENRHPSYRPVLTIEFVPPAGGTSR